MKDLNSKNQCRYLELRSLIKTYLRFILKISYKNQPSARVTHISDERRKSNINKGNEGEGEGTK